MEIKNNDTGKNSFEAGFEGNSAAEHLAKRQHEGNYKNLTVEQYEAMALDLLQQDVGGDIDGYETKNGKIVRWNKLTGDYATGILDAKIKTMFPLVGGQKRFEKLRERDN